MEKIDFGEAVRLIVREDPRYEPGAYHFVREALDFTVKKQSQEAASAVARVGRHVSGQELLEGIREYALERYGCMAHALLSSWGLHRCRDFGEIVFNLIDYEIFSKTDADRREDFEGDYDFETAFLKPFLPRAPGAGPASAQSTVE